MAQLVEGGALHAACDYIARQRADAGKYSGVAHCRAIVDFLAQQEKKSLEELSLAQKVELREYLAHMLEKLRHHSRQLLIEMGVVSESHLSPADRKKYDASMKAVVEREDHYP